MLLIGVLVSQSVLGPELTRRAELHAQGSDRSLLFLPIGIRSVEATDLATPVLVTPPPLTTPTSQPTATWLDPGSSTPGPSRTPTIAGSPTTITPPAGSQTPSPTADASPSPTALPSPTPRTCDAVASFDDGLEPAGEIFIAPDGDDQAGDGSAERPYASIRRAAMDSEPGNAIRLTPGRYAGGHYIEDLRGAEGAPIWLGGIPGQDRPVIEGGSNGLHLVRPAWLVVHDIEVEGASSNGINADDGGEVDDDQAAHHIVFRDLAIRDVGSGGNQDCLKLSGLRDVLIQRAEIARCGGGGSGVDMVGVHRARIVQSDFADMGSNAIQAKGGSADIEIRWNRMRRAGARAVNLGGSTGFDYFRPPLDPGAENAEARDIRLVGNLIEGGDTPWAFVGCVDCMAAHNTVIQPQVWLMRILQETRSADGFDFAPASRGRVINNLFVFGRGQLRADVNVGGGTDPDSFEFANNLWYAADDPARSAVQLPVAEMDGVVGLDPELRPDGSIPAGSPAAGTGLPGPAPDGTWLPGDLSGRCWADPPSIGAFEAP